MAQGRFTPGRCASQWTCRALGNRSRVLFDGVMFPKRSKSSSPSWGVKCATTQVACFAARGVQGPGSSPRAVPKDRRRDPPAGTETDSA